METTADGAVAELYLGVARSRRSERQTRCTIKHKESPTTWLWSQLFPFLIEGTNYVTRFAFSWLYHLSKFCSIRFTEADIRSMRNGP